MAIANWIQQIRHAVYGRDVREAIASGIEECYADTSAGKTTADAASDAVTEFVDEIRAEIDAGNFHGAKGDQGETGTGIESIVQNADDTLTIQMTDGTSYTTDPVRGPQGIQGEQGAPAPVEDVQDAVDAYLDEHITNPSSPPLDRTLTSSVAAAPADVVGDLIKISDTEPTEENNVIWVSGEAENEYTIPTYEEFEELNSAIDATKNNLPYVERYNQYLCETGYITTNGAIVSNSGWLITDYMPIGYGFDVIYSGLETVGSNTVLSAYYTSDKTFISTFKQATGKQILNNIPQNAVYVRMSVILADRGNLSFLSKAIPGFDDIAKVNEDIIKKSYYNYKLDLVWTSGYRIAPNGAVATSTASSATLDYYQVEKDDIIVAYVHSPGSANVVAVYDINKNFIESFTVSNVFAPKKHAITQNGFIRFSNEFGVISAPYAYIERAYKTNDELENEINKSKTDTAKNTGKMPLVWTDGSRIGMDGGFYGPSTSEATKDYYQVTKDQIIILNLFASGAANVALYDEQLEFVSCFNVTTVGETYIVPQNGYMRFSNEKAQVAEPFVKIFSNYLSVEEIEEKLNEIETKTNKIPYIENSIEDIYEKIGETPGSKEYTHTISGIVLRLPSNIEDVTITPSTGVVITGHNLLNTAQYKANKILNDSGTEVSDGSSFYFDSLIPIKNVSRIFTTVPIQRFYYFDQNMQWLGRSGVYSENVTSRAIPLISNLAYIKIQSSYSLFSGNPETAVVSLDGNLEYTPYQTNIVGTVYEEGGVAYSNSFDSIEITYTDSRPLCFPDFWQPNSADSGYSMPIALNQALRSNWTATDKYHYYDFLSAKFDRYIGKYANGYSVTKRFLGQDSKKTGYEIAEYTFSPAYPEHTLLLSSAMNSNEIVTVWGVARLIESLMDEDNLILKAIKDTTKIIIVPFICPSSFDTEPMCYYNANGVRVNKNFNYITSWSQITGANNPKGDYPDSEIETQILKEWVNSYAYKADLWIDCHSDHTPMSSNQHRVCYVFASDDETLALSNIAEQRIKDYYVSAGTADALTDQVFSAIEPGNVYPKTLYGYYMCGIPSIMLEQTIGTTIFGSNGSTINDIPGIKNYTAMLYMLINTLLSK